MPAPEFAAGRVFLTRNPAATRQIMNTSVRDRTNGGLIAADKVQGTSVYNYAGEKLGSVESVMIDKRTGKVAYAILSFGGGFLGLLDYYHPLPWSVMSYDRDKGGYVIALDKKTLENAPRFKAGERIDWEAPEFGRRVDEYYRAPSHRM